MVNPIIIDLEKDNWVMVAESVTFGQIHILETKPEKYLGTYRITGENPPQGVEEGARINGQSIPINSSHKIDVYIMARGDDGQIRVDL